MKKKIAKMIKHPLISGTIIMFIGSGLGSILNFLFNLFTNRNLSLGDYGILASLLSIISLAMIIASSGVPMLVNFGAEYFARKDYAHLRGLFMKSSMYYALVGGLILVLFLIFPSEIGTFFRISQSNLIVLCGITIFIVCISIVNGSLLQAKLSFGFISFMNFVASLCKLVVGIILLFLGFRVSGAMWALLTGFIVSYFLTFFPLRFLFNKSLQAPSFNIKELLSYGTPAAIASFSVTSLISTDIILVKHFFSPDLAGIYAGLSLVGRVIFFLTAPISTVMFPVISQKYAKKEAYDSTFALSILIVLLPSVAITIFYFLFPVFSMHVFVKKKEYLQVANLLGLFGVFITIYSLLNVFTNFYLSIRRTKIWIPIFLAALAQLFFIWMLHDSFLHIIMISLSIATILLIYFIVYYIKIRGLHKEKISFVKAIIPPIPE